MYFWFVEVKRGSRRRFIAIFIKEKMKLNAVLHCHLSNYNYHLLLNKYDIIHGNKIPFEHSIELILRFSLEEINIISEISIFFCYESF